MAIKNIKGDPSTMKARNIVFIPSLLSVVLLLFGFFLPEYAAAEEKGGSIKLLPPRMDRPALAKAMGLKNTQIIVLTQPMGYPAGK